jgi:hypothetical protein
MKDTLGQTKRPKQALVRRIGAGFALTMRTVAAFLSSISFAPSSAVDEWSLPTPGTSANALPCIQNWMRLRLTSVSAHGRLPPKALDAI